MVNLSNDYIKKIRGRFEQALRALQISEKDIDTKTLIENGRELSLKLLENKEISKFISEVEITSYLYKAAHEILILSENKAKLAFGEAADNERIVVAGEKFITFLKGLPYEHDIYFQVSFNLPEGADEIKVTNNIDLVRVSDPKSLGFLEDNSSLIAALITREFPGYQTLKSGETFIRIRTRGYSNKNVSGSATNHAYRLLKQFTYLGVITGVFEYNSWESEKFKPKTFFIRHGLSEEPMWFELPPGTQAFLSKLRLSRDSFTPIPKGGMFVLAAGWSVPTKIVQGIPENTQELINGFHYRMKTSSQFLDDSSTDKKQIERAIEWGFEGLINHDEVNGFIQTCIGLEAILGDKNLGRNSMERLADRCSYFLGKTRDEREQLYANFKQMYEARSNLIHGSADKIEENEKEHVFTAENLLKQLITKEIFQVIRKTSTLSQF